MACSVSAPAQVPGPLQQGCLPPVDKLDPCLAYTCSTEQPPQTITNNRSSALHRVLYCQVLVSYINLGSKLLSLASWLKYQCKLSTGILSYCKANASLQPGVTKLMFSSSYWILFPITVVMV